MEDELEDKILYQTYVSHMKIMSRIVWGVPLNMSPLPLFHTMWRFLKFYTIQRPEILILGTLLLVVIMYMQAVDLWSRTLLGRLQYTINRGGAKQKQEKLASFFTGDLDKASWEAKVGPAAAYAVQGRRPKMEDRFEVGRDVQGTGVDLFAVFDGHGGEFAANYAKDNLIKSLYRRIKEIKEFAVSGKVAPPHQDEGDEGKRDEANNENGGDKRTALERRKSLRKTASTSDECSITTSTQVTDLEILSKLEQSRPISREVRHSNSNPGAAPQHLKKVPASCYLNKTGSVSIVDYGKLLTDEILSADRGLLEKAKKNLDVAGTTALIAILDSEILTVANVGDSRGVMCDGRGNVIPLSFDHKPQQMRERKRIKEAGGFVTFNGVWRVAGILATSRALGDYPLKDKRLVIADPDILTFNLRDHKPLFVVLASDGLWDTFTNEEAVSFIKERIGDEFDYGAKSLTLQAYYRGSLDNITVIVINFKDGSFGFYTSSPSHET